MRSLTLALTITMLCAVPCVGQTTNEVTSAQTSAPAGQPGQSTPGAGTRVTLDRVVAVVNGDLILDSDLDEEARMVAFQPFGDRTHATREQLIDRLIDRHLILQQIRLQPPQPINDTQLDAELSALRKSIPECAACDSDAGWQSFIQAQGFTLDALRDRWRERMEVLRFVEARFRMGIRISQAEIDAYYNSTLLPAYRAEQATPPTEETIADRIQEVLLQKQVDKLLDDWLTSLRAEGSVKIVKPGEELP